MIKQFDYKWIDSNYKKLLKDSLSADIKDLEEDEDSLRILTKTYDKMLNGLDYERLDDYYEQGLYDDNISDDDADVLTVGYALITKYRLSYEDFYKWASAQERRYLVVLYNLIGVKPPVEKRNTENVKIESSVVESLVADISGLEKVLLLSDVPSKWSILEKNIIIPEEELNIVQLRGEISDIDYQSIALFENEFARSCTDCNSALTNVETSMAFAVNAELVKCKKLLAKKNIDEEIIKVIEKRYKEMSDVSDVSDMLQEVLENGIKELKKAASMAEADYDRRSDTEFIGGGFGIKGSLAGMLTANVMGAVYDSFNTSHYKGDLERMTKKFKAAMDKQFVGVEARDKYIETLLDIFESLKQICVEEIYKDRRTNYDKLDLYISKLEKCEKAITVDKYRSIVVDLLCSFPYDKGIYEYINKKFAGVNKELETISKTLDVKFDSNSSFEKNTKIKDVRKNPSRYKNLSYIEINELLAEESKKQKEEYFEKTENKDEYAFNMSFRKNVKAIIQGTEYSDRLVNDYAYNLVDDRVTDVISKQENKAQYVLYLSEYIMLTDTTLYISIDSKEPTVIRIKDTAEIVVGENFYLGGRYRACLCFKNGDLNQVELGVESDESVQEYAFIFDVINIALDPLSDKSRVRMHRKSYAAGSGNIAFCENCGIQRIINDSTGIFNNFKCGKCYFDVSALSRIIRNKIHDKCDIDLEKEIDRLAKSGLFEDENELASKHEIKEFESKKDVEFDNRVLGAYKGQIDIKKGALDYKSAAQYRAILKKFFSSFDNKCVVNKYDYEVLGEVTEYLVTKEKIGQYIIYSDDEVAITDFNVYIRDEQGYVEIPLFDLIEIIPVEKGIKSDFVGYICAHKNGRYEKKYSSCMVSNYEVIWQLNAALAEIYSIRNKKTYMQYFDKYRDKRDDEYVYCNSCKKYVTRYCVHGEVFNGFHCSECNTDMMLGGYDRAAKIPKQGELDEVKKIISDIIHLDIDELIATEIDEDNKKYSGVLEYGILKHEEYEVVKAKEKEEEKKVLSTYNSLFSKHKNNIDGYKKGFFIKENESAGETQYLSKMKGQRLYIGAIDSWGYTTHNIKLSSKTLSTKGLKRVRTVRCFTNENSEEDIPSKTFLFVDSTFECKDFTKKISDDLYCIDSGVILDEYGDMDFFNALIGDEESKESLSKDINTFVFCRRCGEISSIPLKLARKNISCPCCNNVLFKNEYIIIGGSRFSKEKFLEKDILKYLNLESAINRSFEGTDLREILKNNHITGLYIEGDEKFGETVSNATAKYAFLTADEYPIAIHSTALIKKGSSGYLFTNKKFYINTGYSKKTTLDLDSIVGFEVNTENEICVFDKNGTRYPICMPVYDVENETRKICQGLIVCFNYAKKKQNESNISTKKVVLKETKSDIDKLVDNPEYNNNVEKSVISHELNEPVVKTSDQKICPKCKTVVLDTAKFCAMCGTEISKEDKPLMTKCNSCGKEILPSVKFCNFCGQAMVQKKVCAKCGKEISPTAKFCNFCGEKA